MNPEVEDYMRSSGRWQSEMRALHPILAGAGLAEEIKWAKPCYTHEGRNIAIVQEMKDFLALMFFKGVLLDDPDDLMRLGLRGRAKIHTASQTLGQRIWRGLNQILNFKL